MSALHQCIVIQWTTFHLSFDHGPSWQLKGSLMVKSAHCHILEWDSSFFGRRIGRVDIGRLTPDDVLEILQWCSTEKIECLYFLADSAHRDSILLAEAHGFHLMDVRVTMNRKLKALGKNSGVNQESLVRSVEPPDIPALQTLAENNHRDTRFYYDYKFAESRCSAFYRTWIEKSCSGYADAVFVADVKGEIAGYISCHTREGKLGQIGLAGVKDGFRGKGLGTLLVNRALAWFEEALLEKVEVVTQGRNIKAQRLYQQCGFFTCSVNLWYHRWFDIPG
jgi:dTDP-4-amino-4,6-dideoxy-D-galactose acyltransferase